MSAGPKATVQAPADGADPRAAAGRASPPAEHERVTLFGATGTLGFQTFLQLWDRRSRYHLTLVLLSGEAAAQRLKPYATAAGIPWAPPGLGSVEARVQEGAGLTLVWGDARNAATVRHAVSGADWVINSMAVISPAADYRPELADQVNDQAVGLILDAITAEPGGTERIGYVHTGSVAQTGSRPVGVHYGRVGDPLNPSVFDAYAISKIAGERRVLESPLKKWVSLRMSFIMPTQHRRLMGLLDPIAFHMPLDTRMENITDRDGGLALANCLLQESGSPFWRRVYNLAGGPGMRMVAYQYLSTVYAQMGLHWEACSERNWYALRNFHLQYYEDSHEANQYLGHWRDDNASFAAALEASMPLHLRAVRWLTRRVPFVKRLAERGTYATMHRLAEGHRNSPRYWYLHGVEPRLQAFFGGRAAYEAIPDWDGQPVDVRSDAPWRRLNHGYDETRTELALEDLRSAAAFRGGSCLAQRYGGDVHGPVEWDCAEGHRFAASPYTVLRAGHWCAECDRSWNGGKRAAANPFFAQVWYADHGPDELQEYDHTGIQEIAGADDEWRRRGRRYFGSAWSARSRASGGTSGMSSKA